MIPEIGQFALALALCLALAGAVLGIAGSVRANASWIGTARPIAAGQLVFDPVDDALRLDDVVFTGLALGTLASSAFRIGTAAQDADDRIIYNATTGAVLFDADGTGAAAAVFTPSRRVR